MLYNAISECAVVIPIYKEDMAVSEEISLRRCLEVLDGYPIIFVAPHRLDCEKYKQICSEYSSSVDYEFFKNKFFNGFNAYNALMLCSDFYVRFLNYKYILIYQLDAFIYKNELMFWCEQDYDYIGGPFFELQRGAHSPKHTDFLNGGFSLRKTVVFYRIAKAEFRFTVLLYLLLSRYDALMKKPTITNIFKVIFLYSGIKFLSKILKLEPNEDFKWSVEIKKKGKIAPFNKALRFSFDSCPEYAFKLNNRLLPMGCHGWTAYYNRLFWEKFVLTESNERN